MSKFKVGDKVRVKSSGWGIGQIDQGKTTTILAIDPEGFRYDYAYKVSTDGFEYEGYDGIGYTYAGVESFELVEEVKPAYVKPLLIMGNGSVQIELDPNVAFSRKFADAFFNAIYGEN